MRKRQLIEFRPCFPPDRIVQLQQGYLLPQSVCLSPATRPERSTLLTNVSVSAIFSPIAGIGFRWHLLNQQKYQRTPAMGEYGLKALDTTKKPATLGKRAGLEAF